MQLNECTATWTAIEYNLIDLPNSCSSVTATVQFVPVTLTSQPMIVVFALAFHNAFFYLFNIRWSTYPSPLFCVIITLLYGHVPFDRSVTIRANRRVDRQEWSWSFLVVVGPKLKCQRDLQWPGTDDILSHQPGNTWNWDYALHSTTTPCSLWSCGWLTGITSEAAAEYFGRRDYSKGWSGASSPSH